jgi:uncharacterized GH25 family protein
MKLSLHLIKRIALASVFFLPLFTSMQASAHRQFIIPTSTILNGNSPWVSFDAAAATDIFYLDHVALNVNGLLITAADGTFVKAENINTGKLRTSFDLRADQQGTYRISLVNDNLNVSYKVNGEAKRWRGSAEDFAKEVPANAQDLVVTHSQGRIETFVTNGKPNTTALKETGKGLELNPITHPNDLVDGESAQFQILLDGKALAGVNVTVIAAGIRYRHKLDEQTLTTDKDGKISVTWQGAGLYWLNASYSDNKSLVKAAKERRTIYAATLEVLPQ